MFVHVKDSISAFKCLNGVFCIYKPSCISVVHIQNTILTNLCRDLNGQEDTPVQKRVVIEGPTNAPMDVKLVKNYAGMALASGPNYLERDFKMRWGSYLGLFSSGVLLLGINKGINIVIDMCKAKPIRVFKVHGQFGKATDTYFWNGKTVERTFYAHVTREKLDKMLAHMQSIHQKTMFQMSGLHMDSRETYDFASEGIIRPAKSELPVLYGIKCVQYKPPNFILEIAAINMYDHYLWTLVHDLGIQLKSSAYCTAVQCIREGKFTTEHALLRKFWNLSDLLENMSMCNQLISENHDLLQLKSPEFPKVL